LEFQALEDGPSKWVMVATWQIPTKTARAAAAVEQKTPPKKQRAKLYSSEMKWIELREWLALAPADIPCWASFVLLILMYTCGGGIWTDCFGAGSIVLAGVGWAIGARRSPQLGETHHRIKRVAYPAFMAIIIAGVGYRFLKATDAAEDRVDPHATATLVTSTAHKFSISFPPPYHSPEEETKMIGQNSQSTWIATRNNGSLGVSVTVYPEQMFKGNTPEGLLGELHFSMVRHLEGTVEKQEPFLFEGHPALRSVVDHHERKGQKGYSRFELLLVPPRVYAIRTSHSSRETLDRPSMKAFSESFRLNP
jgi:hypothetical protein